LCAASQFLRIYPASLLGNAPLPWGGLVSLFRANRPNRARQRNAGERGTWDKAATGAIKIRSKMASFQARIAGRLGAASAAMMF
jgi:hypothetical protein